MLGDREQPKPKQKKRKTSEVKQTAAFHVDDDTEEQYDDDDMSLHEAILMTHQLREAERIGKEATDRSSTLDSPTTKRRAIKPNSYFSDEDADSD